MPRNGLLPLSMPARTIVLLAGLALVLAMVNRQVFEKEGILREGEIVLLQLAPVDPRSLLQGDYMALNYAMARPVLLAAESAGADDGHVVVQLDEMRAATFVELYTGRTLEQGQHLLRYRKRGGMVRLASDAYFFEEWQGHAYSSARYGELRVSDDGEAVLTGLRDESGQRLGPK